MAETATATPPPLPHEARLPQDARRHVEALDSRACPHCGGKAEWNPRDQALVCPYCDEVLDSRDAAVDEEGVIKEHDLHEALRTIEEATKGVETGERKVHCQSCDAESLRPAARVADRCQFCGSPEVIAYDAVGSVIRPESLLPKSLDKNQAYTKLKAWAGSRFWAPGDLKSKNLVDRMRGVYVPYWTFDAFATCPWRADSGTYYYETRRGPNGQSQRVRKTRWRPASGEVRFNFDDVLVPATEVIPSELLTEIEPFPTRDKLVPYDTVYVSGWEVEHYSGTLLGGAKKSREAMQAVLRNLAAQNIPGDTYRNLRINPSYTGETFKHVLVPAWVVLYQYHGKMFRSVVNGYTGKVAGKYPVSAWKVFFAIVLGLIVLAIVIYFGSLQ